MKTTGGRLGLWLLLGVFCSGSAAADIVPFRVLIHELTQLDGSFDAAGPLGDFYAKVTVAGETMDNESENCGDSPDPLQGMFVPFTLFRNFRATKQDGVAFCPGKVPWIFDFEIDDSAAVDVRIQIFDSDGLLAGGDDEADLLDGGNRSVDLVIDPVTGQWSGDFEFPTSCSRALNELDDNHVRICFQVSFDRDGDGLLDAWESGGGIDMDGDGSIDVPLTGADPLHKDLFFELDWIPGAEPRASAIREVQEAFALAPVDAGGGPNPDGLPGINLRIDTGALVDTAAIEDGAGSCTDGIDNGGDGSADGADPDCLAGDNLGGGNPVPDQELISLDVRFYDIKDGNFDPDRIFAYRYGISASSPTSLSGTSTGQNTIVTFNDTTKSWFPGELTNREVTVVEPMVDPQTRAITSNTATQFSVDAAWDPIPGQGASYSIGRSNVAGLGEIKGNDFAVWVRSASTLMHEIGHTLSLNHGGDEGDNCKPNYVSIMSYDLREITRSDGARFLDFSPSRTSTGRSVAPLPDLNEADLDERVPLEPGNTETFFVWTDPSGTKVRNNVLGDMVNWNDELPADEVGVMVNIDSASSSGFPEACDAKNQALEVLTGYDDWSNLVLSLFDIGTLEIGDSILGAVGDLPDEPTIEELEAGERALNTMDLAVSKLADPDPPEAGGEYLYRIATENRGPNVALAVEVIDMLPAGVTLLDAPPECTETGPVVRCALGVMRAETSAALELRVEASDVCVGGVPQAIVNHVSASNQVELPGPDLEPSDNNFSLTTTPVDTQPPVVMAQIVEITDGGGDPDEARSEIQFVCQDVCDDEPEVVARANGVQVELGQLVVFEQQSEFQAEFEDGILYLEGPAFELVATCTDGSGNESVATATPGTPGLSVTLSEQSAETPEQGCGLGFEIVAMLGLYAAVRERRRRWTH